MKNLVAIIFQVLLVPLELMLMKTFPEIEALTLVMEQ